MRKNVLQILLAISETVSERMADGRNLWDILSALRGPDFDCDTQFNLSDTLTIDIYDLKNATTGVIRYNLGVNKDNARYVVSHPDTGKYAKIRTLLRESDIPTHFISHCKAAFTALGLKWDEVNLDLGGEISYKV